MLLPRIDLHNWQPICFADRLPKSKKIKIKGKNLFITKIENEILIAEDTCPHRAYPLSLGIINENTLQCAYHGWEFNKEGTLTTIPGATECPNIKLKTYFHKIENNLLWVNLGQSPFPEMNKLDKVFGTIELEYKINAPSYLLIENTLDPTHTGFVHNGLVRNDKRKPVKINIKQGNSSVEAVYKNEGKQNGLVSKLFGSKDDVGIGRYIHPGIIQLEYRDSKGSKSIMQACLREENENTTIALIQISYIKHPLVVLKPFFTFFLKTILNQDIKVVEKQFKNMNSKTRFINTELDFLAKPLHDLINEQPREPFQKEIEILL